MLAAVSLWVMPDRIAYDPYSWAIWGREILHGHLNTRQAATSVKPLPMLYDTLFAVTGSHLPTWWLYAARVGSLIAFGAVFRLARRLGGVPAAIVAIVAFAASDGLLSYLFMRGMSEPIAAAAMVAAVDYWLLGRPRAVLGWLVVAAYLRPEAWPFLLVWLMWVAWRRPWTHRVAALVVGAFIPFSWFLIDWFGARTFNRSVNAASLQSEGGPLAHHYPGLATFTETWQLASGPVVVLFGIGVVLAAARWWRSAHTFDVTRVDPSLTISTITLSWIVIDAVLAQGHFATGAPRYLLPADALGCVVVGRVVAQVGDWLVVRGRTGVAGLGRLRSVAAAGAVVVAIAALTPALLDAGRRWHDGVRHGRQDGLLERHLATAIRRAGGRDAVVRCGAVATQNYQVPLVAWKLHVHIEQVGIGVSAPGTVFQQAGQPAIPAALLRQFHVAADITGSPLSSWRALSSC